MNVKYEATIRRGSLKKCSKKGGMSSVGEWGLSYIVMFCSCERFLIPREQSFYSAVPTVKSLNSRSLQMCIQKQKTGTRARLLIPNGIVELNITAIANPPSLQQLVSYQE